jgi:hypothetical protein
MKANEPFAGDTVTCGFRRTELPAARGFQCEIGEIRTGSGRIERSLGDIPCGIDLHADADADYSMNGSEGFRGGVGQNLIEDFTARGSRRGR